MGANQSRSFDFYCDYAIYHASIESIEAESPSRVYNKIMEEKFASRKQMQAVSTIIYEKAVVKPHLSMKCAQLVKELEAETYLEKDGPIFFHTVFIEYIINLVKSFVAYYDDTKMSDYAVQRGKSIAKFIANLYLADAFILTPIIEIGQIVRQRETPRSKFFLQTILSLISRKMATENVSLEIFEMLLVTGIIPVDSDEIDENFDHESIAVSKFVNYLDRISEHELYAFYGDFKDFQHISEKGLEVEIKILYKDAIKNRYMINAYRDIALEIHYNRPDGAINNLNNLFNKGIERYEVIKDKENQDELINCNIIGKTLVEFFNNGLLDEQVVEHFLSAVKPPKAPFIIFAYAFIDVLKRYRGKNMFVYLEHFKKLPKKSNLPDWNIVVPVVEEYVMDKEVQIKRLPKTKESHGIFAADFPDIREFSTKCLTLKTKESSNHKATFICENRPSCHFASLRGLELLQRHIGHKFFTPERIGICTKMTKESLKFQISEEVFLRELKTYLPYFDMDVEPTRKLANFSNFMASSYKEKLVDHKIITIWVSHILNSFKEGNNKFGDQLKEIYVTLFERVSTQLKHDNRFAWHLQLDTIDSFESHESVFPDYEKFKDVLKVPNIPNFEGAKFLNVVNLKKLQNVKIPNTRKAMKLISNHLLNLYAGEEMSIPGLTSLISMLPSQAKPELDKTLLRTEIQEDLCLRLGQFCTQSSDTDRFSEAKSLIDLIEAMCVKTLVTRLGLANLLIMMADVLYSSPYSVLEVMNYFNEKCSGFLIGSKPLPSKVEKIILEVMERIKKSFEAESDNYLKIRKVLKVFEDILEDNKQKKKLEERKTKNVKESAEKLETNAVKEDDLRDSSSSPPAITEKHPETKTEVNPSSSTPSESGNSENNYQPGPIVTTEPSTSTQSSTMPDVISQAITKPKESSNPSTPTQPKLSREDIEDYKDYCDYYNSLEEKSSEDDRFLFDPTFLSSIRIIKKEQIIDLSKKFIERVIAGQSTVLFFVQNAQKIGAVVQNYFKLKNQKVSFQKILVDEIFAKFQNEKIVVKFMCELYNNCFVNKASMVAFVDKFKTQSPENLILMHTFVRTCAIRLSTQGDKEQLIQIRGIARSAKNQANYDEDLKFMAQDLANSTNSLILLLESGQNKAQVLSEAPEKLVDDLLKNVLKNPQLYVKSASKLDGKMKDLLIHKLESIIKEVPTFVIKLDQFMNLIEFIAELYNLEFLKNDFMNFTIEIFMTSSTNEICSKSIEFLFSKCGQKIENMNKHKFDIYFKFFDAVLSEEEDTVRSECFKRIKKLRTRKWKTLNVPQNFYEDFLMLFSTNDGKVEDLVEILKCDEEEIDKFIQILWKIILKDPPHPSYSILCEEISKSCENFVPKLTTFLTARCITFIGFDSDFFNENIKQRLGKVMTFVAEIYNKKLVADEILEMWMDQKLTSKLPSEFVARIFSILSTCKRLEGSQNDRLKTLVKNFDDIYYRGMDAQINSIIKGLDSIKKNVN